MHFTLILMRSQLKWMPSRCRSRLGHIRFRLFAHFAALWDFKEIFIFLNRNSVVLTWCWKAARDAPFCVILITLCRTLCLESVDFCTEYLCTFVEVLTILWIDCNKNPCQYQVQVHLIFKKRCRICFADLLLRTRYVLQGGWGSGAVVRTARYGTCAWGAVSCQQHLTILDVVVVVLSGFLE